MNMNTAASVSVRSMVSELMHLKRDMDWLSYEVDPEWKAFCEFGPEDIGGPFEKLGIIRKKQRPTMLALSQETLARVDALNRESFTGKPSTAATLMGIPVMELPSGSGDYAVNLAPYTFSIDGPYRVYFDL